MSENEQTGTPEALRLAAWLTDGAWHKMRLGDVEAAGRELRRLHALTATPSVDAAAFQARVQPWLLACFGEEIAGDRKERNHRFLEESLELVQACGCSESEAHQLVKYVFGRPVGHPPQEAGGVMVTLAALCLANAMDMHLAAEIELARINEPDTVLKIRAKQAAKPKHSPLPQAVPLPTISLTPRERVLEIIREHAFSFEPVITAEHRLAEDLSFDSLDQVELEMSLEDAFGIVVDDGESNTCKTVQDVLNLLTAKGVAV